LTLPTAAPPEPAPAPDEPIEQAPAEEAPPLVEPEPETPSDLEVTERGDDEDKEEEPTETAAEEAAPTEAPPLAEAEPANDDAFDEAPVFGRPRMALPNVDLPEGETAANPGDSGVVAIFCPEEFKNKDKAAECAGRTEIKSGWRPGSGENYDEAIRLLKKDRQAGRDGVAPSAILGAEGRAIEAAAAVDALKDFRRSQDAINDPAGASSGNIDNTLGQPNIGPREFEPGWTIRDDPTVSREEAEKLKKALEEAEKRKSGEQPESE
jgi:hypothetical protein